MSKFADIPKEIVLEIFQYLDIPDMLRASRITRVTYNHHFYFFKVMKRVLNQMKQRELIKIGFNKRKAILVYLQRFQHVVYIIDVQVDGITVDKQTYAGNVWLKASTSTNDGNYLLSCNEVCNINRNRENVWRKYFKINN